MNYECHHEQYHKLIRNLRARAICKVAQTAWRHLQAKFQATTPTLVMDIASPLQNDSNSCMMRAAIHMKLVLDQWDPSMQDQNIVCAYSEKDLKLLAGTLQEAAQRRGFQFIDSNVLAASSGPPGPPGLPGLPGPPEAPQLGAYIGRAVPPQVRAPNIRPPSKLDGDEENAPDGDPHAKNSKRAIKKEDAAFEQKGKTAVEQHNIKHDDFQRMHFAKSTSTMYKQKKGHWTEFKVQVGRKLSGEDINVSCEACLVFLGRIFNGEEIAEPVVANKAKMPVSKSVSRSCVALMCVDSSSDEAPKKKGRRRRGEKQFDVRQWLEVKRPEIYSFLDGADIKNDFIPVRCNVCCKNFNCVRLSNKAFFKSHERSNSHGDNIKICGGAAHADELDDGDEVKEEPKVSPKLCCGLQLLVENGGSGASLLDVSFPISKVAKSVQSYIITGCIGVKDGLTSTVDILPTDGGSVVRAKKCSKDPQSHFASPGCCGLCLDCYTIVKDPKAQLVRCISNWVCRVDTVTLLFHRLYSSQECITKFSQELLNRDYLMHGFAGNDLQQNLSMPVLDLLKKVRLAWTCIPPPTRNAALVAFIAERIDIMSDIDVRESSVSEAERSLMQTFAASIAKGEVVPDNLKVAAKIASGALDDNVAQKVIMSSMIIHADKIKRGKTKRPCTSQAPDGIDAAQVADTTFFLSRCKGGGGGGGNMLSNLGINPRGNLTKINLQNELIPNFFVALSQLGEVVAKNVKTSVGLGGQSLKSRAYMITWDETVNHATRDILFGWKPDGSAVIIGGAWSSDEEDDKSCIDVEYKDGQAVMPALPEDDEVKLSLHFLVKRIDSNRNAFDVCMLPVHHQKSQDSTMQTVGLGEREFKP